MCKPTLALVVTLFAGLSPARAAVTVSPPAVTLDGPEASQQLLVTLDAPIRDGTRTATYETADRSVAVVDPTGAVVPRGEGRTEVVVRHGADVVRVPVTVTGL